MVRLRDPRGDDFVYTSKSLRSVDCILPGSFCFLYKTVPSFVQQCFQFCVLIVITSVCICVLYVRAVCACCMCVLYVVNNRPVFAMTCMQ